MICTNFLFQHLIYIPQGRWKSPTNWSGTTLYLGKNLSKICKQLGVKWNIIDTPHLINTEDIFYLSIYSVLKDKRKFEQQLGKLWPEQLNNPLSDEFLKKIKFAKDWSSCREIAEEYIFKIRKGVEQRVLKIANNSSVVLAVNTLNPPLKLDLPVFYYLDIPLAEFYFDKDMGINPEFRKIKDLMNFYKMIEVEALSNAAGILFFSQFAERKFEQLYPQIKIPTSVVGAGANLDNIPNFRIRNFCSPLRLLFVGRDFWIKGGDILVDAVETLDPNSFKLTIVTEKQYHPKSSAFPHINFVAPQEKDIICDLYFSHDIFVFPTRLDAFGIVICEAMVYGMPVLASNIRAIPEIIGNLPGFILPNNLKTRSLANVLNNLASNPNKLLSVSRRNYLRATRLFSWPKIAGSIIETLSCMNMNK